MLEKKIAIKEKTLFDYSALAKRVEKKGYKLSDLSIKIGHGKDFLKNKIKAGTGMRYLTIVELMEKLDIHNDIEVGYYFMTLRKPLQDWTNKKDEDFVFFPDDTSKNDDFKAAIRSAVKCLDNGEDIDKSFFEKIGKRKG